MLDGGVCNADDVRVLGVVVLANSYRGALIVGIASCRRSRSEVGFGSVAGYAGCRYVLILVEG